MPILSNNQIQDLAIQKANTAKNPELAMAIIQRAEKILQNRMEANGIYEDNISWSTRTKVGLIEKMEVKKLKIARFGILGHLDGPDVNCNLGKNRIVVEGGSVLDIGNISNVDLPNRGKSYDPFASRDRGSLILKNGKLGHHGDTFDK